MDAQFHDAARQRAQVLALLGLTGNMTTAQFREAGIMHPAGRIMELRRLGHVIETVKMRLPAEDGRLHTQACYMYRGQK